jgi:NADPH-dependent dioxygenase
LENTVAADVRPEILIVGAGPVGLISALELARRNVPIRLIERRRAPSSTARAFSLHARTMEMFEHIGIAHRLEEVSLMCPGNVYHFPGTGMADEDKPRTDFRVLSSRYAFYCKLNQNDFEQVLREHLLASYGIVPEYGRELDDLNNRPDHVEVQIRHAEDERIEIAHYSWVIGADGSRSKVRTLSEIPFPGDRVGVMSMMDVELDDVSFDDSWVNYFIGEKVFMLVTKLPGAYWRVYLSDAGAMTNRSDPQRSFQAVADDLGIGVKIRPPHWCSHWDVFDNVAQTYRKGRVLICGDASHVHSPAGGQGMNGCMQDAFNLGWKLAAVYGGAAPESVLDSYETERKPIGKQITAGAKATHDILMAFGRNIEDRVTITRQPEWQRTAVELISGISHNYRDTVKVPGELTTMSGPQAGERAPDAELCGEPRRRVFDVLRHCDFTLLLVPAAGSSADMRTASEVAESMTASYGPKVRSVLIADEQAAGFDSDHWFADRTGDFTKSYGIPSGAGRAVLIRPDMYVAAHCGLDEAHGLVGYLRQWLLPLPARPGSART